MAELKTGFVAWGAVCLRLEEADAEVELGGYVEILVVLGEGADEGRVVGGEEGLVGVGAVFGLGLLWLWLWEGVGEGEDVEEGEGEKDGVEGIKPHFFCYINKSGCMIQIKVSYSKDLSHWKIALTIHQQQQNDGRKAHIYTKTTTKTEQSHQQSTRV